MFSDMKDFTALSEKLDPEDMDGLMETIFSRFERIVREHDGTVEKYIGDALVAVFGVPNIHEDDPSRAINAALSFHAEIDDINRERNDDTVALAFRIGIHTGLITTGRRGDYEVVTGHAMSVASRLQSNAGPGEVLVSDSTRRRAEQDFVFGDARDVRLKGKSESVRAYRVLGRDPNPLFAGGEFFGRRELLARITQAYLRHHGRTPGGFLLTGDIGIGKTRLAGQFIEQARALPSFDVAVLTARARMYRKTHFSVMVDLLLTFFKAGPASHEALIEEATRRLGIDRDSAKIFADLSTSESEHVGEHQAIIVLYAMFRSIFEQSAKSAFSPLVVIDNYQFADPQSRDFLEFLLKNIPTKPFFVITARTGTVSNLGQLSQLDVAEVPPLSAEESEQLINALWPNGGSEETRRTILRSSAGNPLFIEEYVRYARESSDSATIPSTIQSILLSSIEAYPHGRRNLLRKLSVFKQSFSRPDARFVEEHTDGNPEDVEKALDTFVRDGIIIETDAVLSFKHDVLKQTLYSSLLNHNKRILHRVVAELMRKQEQPHLERLLHHLARGGLFEELADTIEARNDAHSNADVLPYVDIVLRESGRLSGDRRRKFLFMKSAIQFNCGNSAESDAIVREMFEIATQTQRFEYAASAFHITTGHHIERFEFQKAKACGERALSHYRLLIDTTDNDDDDVLQWRRAIQNVRYLLTLANSLSYDYDLADEYIAQIEGESEESDVTAAEARSESSFIRGEYRESIEAIEPYLKRSSNSAPLHQGMLYSAMRVCWQLFDYQRMLALLDQLIHTSVPKTSYLSQIHAARAVAEFHVSDSHRSDAGPERSDHRTQSSRQNNSVESYLRQAEFYILQIRTDFGKLDALRTLALASYDTGYLERAEQHARAGAAIGLHHSGSFPTLTCLMILVELLDRRGDTEAADFFLREAAGVVQQKCSLPSHDLILFHYYRCTRFPDDPMCSESLHRASVLLDHECREIRDPERFRLLIATRGFARVVEWLESHGVLSQQVRDTLER